MSLERQQQQVMMVKDLVEEAKKRIVILVICVVGLSYLMSLTSSSVWVNLPAAASLIILLRYFALDYEMRRKAGTYNRKSSSTDTSNQNKPLELTKVTAKSDWRKKVNSPVVEDAIDHFTRHLISEWVTDLWYSRLTPDRQGPEELVHIMNGVFGEFSSRLRNTNLIDLLTRDLIDLICNHLELFRASQAKIEKQHPGLLTIEQRDKELRHVLAADNKLHPALFSAQAEHKVLQHLMNGLITVTFRPEDLQCNLFRYIARELLASAVMRPVVNLANPRFINERIEILVLSRTKKAVVASEDASQVKPNGSARISSDHFSRFLDPTGTGVELVQLKNGLSKSENASPESNKGAKGEPVSKDPLLSMYTGSTRSWSSLPLNSQIGLDGGPQRHNSGGEWGEILDVISRRKTAALAPENFENMWTKGRDYKKKEGENGVIEQVPQNSLAKKAIAVDQEKKIFKPSEKDAARKLNSSVTNGAQSVIVHQPAQNILDQKNHSVRSHSRSTSCQGDDDMGLMQGGEAESSTGSSYTSDEEDASGITGFNSPGTMVWDGKAKRNHVVSHIHHPLENFEGHTAKKTGRRNGRIHRLHKSNFGRKRSRSNTQNLHVWQEVERTSFFSGDGQDILSATGHAKANDSSDSSEVESLGRVYRGASACSSTPSISIIESNISDVNTLKNSLVVDSFFKLRCEVLGANVVKSGPRMFAVYSISVTDSSNNSWSIKRRFRHFEELHRRLKEYTEYTLHLPPKHFLSTGLDIPTILERCKLLDRYLKNLLQLPKISGSIEVWDFLSVDSQTYMFSNSFSIIETLSVKLDDQPSEKNKRALNFIGPVRDPLPNRRDQVGHERQESAMQTKHNIVDRGAKDLSFSPGKKVVKDSGKFYEESGSDSDAQKNILHARNMGKVAKVRQDDGLQQMSEKFDDADSDPSLPAEWVPPNLTVPVLDFVEVVFQLQDGGWIRRKAFWVAKQILQLGMGDALDDWLIEKIQLLRRASVIASGIKRVEQILWPDGIFITKHPKRRPQPSANLAQNSPHGQQSLETSSPALASPLSQQPAAMSSPRLTEEQQREADRRAKFVYELMIDNAPAAVVGLVGRREYEQCVKDLYFFLQSSVFLKQLAYDLLELVLLSAFPELDRTFRQLQEEKHKFGELKP